LERLIPLYSRWEIANRVEELAEAMNRDYEGKKLVMVGILKGAFVFLADLIRCLKVPSVVDFVGLSSYGLANQSSQQIVLTKDLQVSIEGRDVLVVEDILDTGLSVDFVLKHLRERRPGSLRLCALIDKPERRIVPVAADYVGFKLDRGFVAGYGIDYAERYRHLPDIHRVEFDHKQEVR
jgi:hypoxanthine phosphoribosyltransferase